jgi:hypothetical protein
VTEDREPGKETLFDRVYAAARREGLDEQEADDLAHAVMAEVSPSGTVTEDRDALVNALLARREELNVEARRDCWCATIHKPCPEHDAYDDGMLAIIDLIETGRAQ